MKHNQSEVSFDHPLPENIDAERFVLGCCLQSVKNTDLVTDGLTGAEFSLESHRIIFRCIKELHASRLPIDRVILAEALLSRGSLQAVGGLTYLSSLDEHLPVIHNLDGYIRIVKQKYELRQIIDITIDIRDQALGGADDAKSILKSLESRIYKLNPDARQARVVRLGDYIEDNYGVLIQPSAHRGKGIYTGYIALDELTGGMFPGEIWLWGAAPGVGKTSIALQVMMHNVRRGLPVLFFSLEMSKQSILNRLSCQIAEVSVKRFRAGELSDKERLKMSDAFAELREMPIFIDDSHALTPTDVRSRITRAVEDHGVQFSIIDYIQKMRPDFSRGSGNDKLTEICDSLIGIAKELTPLKVLSQLSRGHRKLKQKPSLEDLRDSGSLEQMAHVVIFPYREEMEQGKSGDEKLKGVAEFIMAKQREGERAEIPMRFIGWKQIYEDVASAYEDQQQMEY